jgi:TRAP-type C4-dicarboxylate transport system permease small subunit
VATPGAAARRLLDGLYLAGGVIAAVFMVAILCIIVAQMVTRWMGVAFPGATSYAGYCMAGASFFAFAYALGHGAHIRVSLALNAVGDGRRWLELWCFGIGAVIATYFAYYAIVATSWSYRFNDVSQGLDATPLWIPQLSMCAGSVLLAVAFWDHLLRVILLGRHDLRENAVDEPTH